MSKFRSTMFALSLLVGLTSHVSAQIPTVSPPKPSSPQTLPSTSPTKPQAQPTLTPSPAPTPSANPTATNADLKLLGKAIGIFWQGSRAETESQIVMSIQDKSANTTKSFQINATVKTIAQTGDKFRSELVISPIGSNKKVAYTIVGDGQKVWIYRPDKRQYTQITFTEFKAQFYSLLVGLSSVFFVSMSEAGRQEVITNLAKNNNPLQAIPQDKIKDLQGSTRQVDGQNLYAYAYDNKSEKLNFVAFVDPQTAILKQLEFNSNIEGMVFTLSEKISSHKIQPAPTDRMFRFSPPRGVKKVKSLPIELFPGQKL
jgi:outer membrane lipoprotein-sorting protein